MRMDGCIEEVKAGVIFVDDTQGITGRTKIKRAKAMEELVENDRRYIEPETMDIKRLWR